METKNTIMAVFSHEEDAADAFRMVKTHAESDDYKILSAVLVRKTGYVSEKEAGFTSPAYRPHYTLFGWMTGALAGIFFGVNGVLLGAFIGMVIGVILDDRAVRKNEKEIARMAESLPHDHTALLLLAEESSTAGLNALLKNYSMTAVRSEAETKRASAGQQVKEKIISFRAGKKHKFQGLSIKQQQDEKQDYISLEFH